MLVNTRAIKYGGKRPGVDGKRHIAQIFVAKLIHRQTLMLNSIYISKYTDQHVHNAAVAP